MYNNLIFLLFLIAVDVKQTAMLWEINQNNGWYETPTKKNPLALYEGNPVCRHYVHWRQSHGRSVIYSLIEFRTIWFFIHSAISGRPDRNVLVIYITLLIVVMNCIMLFTHTIVTKNMKV